jgi:hypothetical protein
MTDDLLVQLFYAAQGDITRFRIKARKLLADDGKGGAGDAFDEEDAFQEWWKTRTGKMTNAYHGWMARAALASSDAQADGGKGEAVAWMTPSDWRTEPLATCDKSVASAWRADNRQVTPLCIAEQAECTLTVPIEDVIARFEAEHGPIPQAECAPRVDDLSALVTRLARALRKAVPDNDLSEKALDYLKREGLVGSPLRAECAPREALTDDLRESFERAARKLGADLSSTNGVYLSNETQRMWLIARAIEKAAKENQS